MTSSYWSIGIDKLKAYVPGEQPQTDGWVKLNTNECPYPPSPLALQAIREATSDKLRLYPDPNGTALKATIAKHFGLSPAQVFLGNGSDEVLGHAFLGLLKHELPILYPDVTYSFYPVYCGLYGIAYRQVPLTADFAVNLADYAVPNGGIVLPNPNAPTGVALSLDTLRSLLQANRASVVVVDEAYVDFGAQSAAALIPEFDNLLVVQTLSKSRALAGLRVGFALGHPALIEGLARVKDSFNSYPLDRLALVGAQAAIEDQAYFEQITSAVVQSRDWLTAELATLGFATLPSSANFVFTHHPQHQAAWLLAQLRERRILVRHFTQARIADYLRISIGTQQECETLIAALRQIVSNPK
ncbi:histidinol-phosphate transaminase [Rhodoferax sp. GW822-FHT02A01]|uniref:histidinol-phosphate transaminase n=1 Tax=Rhodoferax sp. GW822-FHT02A01 TaxID=3141537 RepID=UPI00315CAC20